MNVAYNRTEEMEFGSFSCTNREMAILQKKTTQVCLTLKHNYDSGRKHKQWLPLLFNIAVSKKYQGLPDWGLLEFACSPSISGCSLFNKFCICVKIVVSSLSEQSLIYWCVDGVLGFCLHDSAMIICQMFKRSMHWHHRTLESGWMDAEKAHLYSE